MNLPWWSPALWVGLCLAWRKDATMAALIGYHVLCFLGAAPAWRTLRWGRIPRWSWVLLAAMAILVPCLFRLPPLPDFPIAHLRQVVARWPGGLPTHALYVVLVNVPLEEAFWRGVQIQAHREWPTWAHGAAFGLHHLVGAGLALGWGPAAAAAFLLPALAGAFWTRSARRDGLALPLLTHLLADAGLMAIAASQLR